MQKTETIQCLDSYNNLRLFHADEMLSHWCREYHKSVVIYAFSQGRSVDQLIKKYQERFESLRMSPDTAQLVVFDQLQRTLQVQTQAEIELRMLLQKDHRPVLAFSLPCKGGAQLYFKRRLEEYLLKGHAVILLVPDGCGVQIQLYWQEFSAAFLSTDLDFLTKEEFGAITEIAVNSLMPVNCFFQKDFSDPGQMADITDYILDVQARSGASMEFCFHDYYPLCPYLNMLTEELRLCDDCTEAECDRCVQKQRPAFYPHSPTFSIHQWRQEYLRLFRHCDRLLFFSEDTLARYKRFLPELNETADAILLRPHRPITSFAPLQLNADQGMVIGVIGSISDQKGAALVIGLANFIEEKQLPAQLIVIGEMLTAIPRPASLRITGRYQHELLPKIVLENHINIGWLPSIAPETFSFVTLEMMQMEIPSACFDVGAPRDRLSDWEKGTVIPTMTPESAWETLLNLFQKHYSE